MIILRLKAVMAQTGLSRSSIYKFIAEDTFPKPVSLGDRAIGFVESEVQDWIKARVEERNFKLAIRTGVTRGASSASLRGAAHA